MCVEALVELARSAYRQRRERMPSVDRAGGASAIPSGKQVSLARDSQQATIVGVGGGIRTYEVAGVAVLDGYRVDERCMFARGLPLIPWPNRLQHGRYTWDGEHYQVPINEVEKDNAIHGYTRWLNWALTTDGPDTAVAALRLHPQDGYPFILDLSVTYSLGPGGLTVTNTATNVGSTDCPYAHGAHPYISVGTEKIDTATLTMPAATYLPVDDAEIPIGRAPVAGTEFDFRSARRIGSVQIDRAFTDLTRDADGTARVVMSSSATGRAVTLWVDSSYPYIMLFTGDTIDPSARRRDGLGVEPMTCPPNGFATGENIRRLEPGASVTTRWGISVDVQ
jgi:aldose 1-epimerase